MRRTPLLLGAFLLACPRAFAAQDTAPADLAAIRPAPTVDARYRTPRATVRTFLIAMNLTEDDPHKIDEAIACFDMSGIPPERRNGGRYAFELEFILRSTNMPTMVIPNEPDGHECEIGEGKDIKLRLHKLGDGRWLFDSATIQSLPSLRLLLWQRAVAADQGKKTDDVPADFRSPYALFHTYIDALKKNDLDRAAECLDLSEIPDPARKIVGRSLAIKLKEVLDRSVFIIFQDVPDNSVGVPLEAVVHAEGRIAAERQPTGKRKGEWLMNAATVRSLDRLYDAFEFKPIVPELAATGRTPDVPAFRVAPGLWLRHHVPPGLRRPIGGAGSFSAYQLAGMVLAVALVIPVYRLVVSLLARAARAILHWRGVTDADPDTSAWVRPIGWLAAVWMLVEAVAMLDLRIEAAGMLLGILVPALWLAVGVAAYQLVDPILKLVARPGLARDGMTSMAAMGYPVISLVLKIVVVICGLAAVLKLFDFDVGTVLAGLGIGGLAFALAAQDSLKNFFGSLMLIADRTFRVGDHVQIGGNEGVVESVGLRITRIRGLDDSLLTIPNSDLTTAHVTNFGARRYRRFRTQITVPYGTPPARLVEFRDGIVEVIRRQAGVRQDNHEVALNDLGAKGVEVLVQVFLDVPGRHAELLARDNLVLELIRLADRLGIAPLAVAKPSPGQD
jgi:MscS family membrane protein